MIQIAIDPRVKLVYASMYIYGLCQLYGKENVVYSVKPFKDLNQHKGSEDLDHYFAFFNNKTKKRYIVDYRDKNEINYIALDWCDVYAKVNLNTAIEDYKKISVENKKKIIGIGPNFGVKIYTNFKIHQLLITNYLKSKFFLFIPVSFRLFSSGYNWMIKRQWLDDYETSNTKDNYIFHISTLYQNQNYSEITNELRAEFIRTCKNLNGVLFEGGLFTKSKDKLSEKYKDIVVNQYIPIADYIKKTKESVLVFNTPSAWGCHGWKLGEYFAMGKAIISTPFYNNIPEGIFHGVNIHIVDDVSQMKKSVEKILNDYNYRNKLQMGARQYYNEFLKPEAVINRIISHK